MNIFIGPVRPPGRHRRHSHVDRELERFAAWNAANDPLHAFRRGIAAGENPLVPFMAGLLGSDLPEYTRLMALAFKAGYSVQRHALEQHGYAGTAPMLVRK